jgi:hypothetical protein
MVQARTMVLYFVSPVSQVGPQLVSMLEGGRAGLLVFDHEV